MKRLFLLNLFIFSCANAYSEENWCRNIVGDNEFYSLGRIIKSSNYYVDSDSEYPNTTVKDCPATSTNCIDKYNKKVILNSELILGKSYKNFVCVYAVKNQSSGWLPMDSIVRVESSNFSLEKLIGIWIADYSKINIKKHGLEVSVSGTSRWDGLIDDNGNRIENIGQFHGTTLLSNIQTGKFEIYDNEIDCRVKFNFVDNKYLIVSDNSNCGGMNVRFDGVFKKNKTSF